MASQGPGRYLLDCEEVVDGKPQGQIIDTKRGRIFPQQFIGSIIARGYWDECQVSPEAHVSILDAVRPAPEGAARRTPAQYCDARDPPRH